MARTKKTKKPKKERYPTRYLPRTLSKRDRLKQLAMLRRSKRLYRKGRYYTRKRLTSFTSRRSRHLKRAATLYGTSNISSTNQLLAKRSGCSPQAMRAIVRKGEGAYYSSGSRPNQTARSWGLARLASALTGGKAAAVDFHILKTCDHSKPAYKKALKVKGTGQRATRKVKVR